MKRCVKCNAIDTTSCDHVWVNRDDSFVFLTTAEAVLLKRAIIDSQLYAAAQLEKLEDDAVMTLLEKLRGA